MVIGILCVGLIGFGVSRYITKRSVTGIPDSSSSNTDKTQEQAGSMIPLDRANERVTKKPFGIFIDKATSPVQPERFKGYHTGTDFETFADEASADVAVKAICDGRVLQKRQAPGYGGILISNCTLGGQLVTVIYGHLRLSSIKVLPGTELKKGDEIGLLGTGFSFETDRERKHLHLGIHKGFAINILGYVQKKEELSQWIDPCQYVCGKQ